MYIKFYPHGPGFIIDTEYILGAPVNETDVLLSLFVVECRVFICHNGTVSSEGGVDKLLAYRCLAEVYRLHIKHLKALSKTFRPVVEEGPTRARHMETAAE
jgi:hypothetical protein